MTYADAMPLLGCSGPTVARLVREGRIRSREQAWRAWPSLWRQDVERVAAGRAEERQAAEARSRARPLSLPPDDEHVWLTPVEAALVLGMSRPGVHYRAQRELLPHVKHGRRVWFRRDHIEQAAAARAFVAASRRK
jgi:hypothetical protein